MGLDGRTSSRERERLSQLSTATAEMKSWRKGSVNTSRWSVQMTIIRYIEALAKARGVPHKHAIQLILDCGPKTRNATFEWIKSTPGQDFLSHSQSSPKAEYMHVASRRRRQA